MNPSASSELIAAALAAGGVGSVVVAIRSFRLHRSAAGELRALRQRARQRDQDAQRILAHSGRHARQVVARFRRAAERASHRLVDGDPESVLSDLAQERERALAALGDLVPVLGWTPVAPAPSWGPIRTAVSRADASRASGEIQRLARERVNAVVNQGAGVLRQIEQIEREWLAGPTLPPTPEAWLAEVATSAMGCVVEAAVALCDEED